MYRYFKNELSTNGSSLSMSGVMSASLHLCHKFCDHGSSTARISKLRITVDFHDVCM